MRHPIRILAAMLPLLLAACVPAPAVRQHGDAAMLSEQQAREQVLSRSDHWTLQGKLFVSDGKQGNTGNLSWTQAGDQYDFVLRAPITGKSFRLHGGPDGAVLEGLDGGPLQGTNAEELMQRALGWNVPLNDLQAWVRGMRAGLAAGNDVGAAELSFGADRLPSLLVQDGWTVEYRKWDVTHQPPLPEIVFATKLPYKVKLSVESWQSSN